MIAFPTEIASPLQEARINEMLVAAMADDIIDGCSDFSDVGIVTTLLARGWSSRNIAACMDAAVMAARQAMRPEVTEPVDIAA